jgi:C1A family cysteine protease
MTDYCGFGYNYTTTYSNGTKVSTTDTTPGSDANIMRYIKEQGVVVGMLNATNLASSGYSSGIYSYATCPTCSSCTNHAIVIVGWGTQNGTDYWIIKNSWGSSWGESGYFRMKRGVNMCAINNWFYFPIVSSTAPINITCSSG